MSIIEEDSLDTSLEEGLEEKEPPEKWMKRCTEISMSEGNPTCRGCKKEISQRYRPYNGYAWHPECLQKHLKSATQDRLTIIDLKLTVGEVAALIDVIYPKRNDAKVKHLYDTLSLRLFGANLSLVPCGWYRCRKPIHLKASVENPEVQRMLRFLSLVSGSRTTKILRFCSVQHSELLLNHLKKKLSGYPLAKDAFMHLVEDEQKRRLQAEIKASLSIRTVTGT